MRRLVLTYGLIGGAVLAAVFIATFQFKELIGFDRGALVGYASMVMAFLMVYFGVRSYRDTVAGGTVTVVEALKVGLLISTVITACYVVAWEIAYYVFMPDFMDQYAAYAIEQARAAGATEEEVARKTKEMADFITMYRNPLVNIAFTVLEPLPVAVVFTLVTAGILGRRRAAAPRTTPGSAPV